MCLYEVLQDFPLVNYHMVNFSVRRRFYSLSPRVSKHLASRLPRWWSPGRRHAEQEPRDSGLETEIFADVNIHIYIPF